MMNFDGLAVDQQALTTRYRVLNLKQEHFKSVSDAK